MIWKYLEQNVLFPKDLNWVQHLVSRIGLLPIPYPNLLKFLLTLLHDNSVITDIDDYPCPNNVPYSFPVVLAGIIKCSTYAVVSRLKLSPTFTITVSGGTFVHPNYPEVTITVPQKAVTTQTRLYLELGVGCLR